jgi:REP element-mobilizing transposase RayT
MTWRTKNSEPTITPDLREVLKDAMAAGCKEIRCILMEFGGAADHVHVLVRFPSTVAIEDIARRMKGGSSFVARRHAPECAEFRWQTSYDGRTLGPEAIERVREYIQRQEEHHARGSMHSGWEPSTDDD